MAIYCFMLFSFALMLRHSFQHMTCGLSWNFENQRFYTFDAKATNKEDNLTGMTFKFTNFMKTVYMELTS